MWWEFLTVLPSGLHHQHELWGIQALTVVVIGIYPSVSSPRSCDQELTLQSPGYPISLAFVHNHYFPEPFKDRKISTDRLVSKTYPLTLKLQVFVTAYRSCADHGFTLEGSWYWSGSFLGKETLILGPGKGSSANKKGPVPSQALGTFPKETECPASVDMLPFAGTYLWET